MTTYYKGDVGVEDIQWGTGTFNRYDQNKSPVSRNQVNRGDIPRLVLSKTADFVITSEVGEVWYTNESAIATIDIELPTAISGKGPFCFTIVETQTLSVSPKAADYFRDCVAGKNKSSNVPGNTLKVWCDVSGIWEYDYELVSGNWSDEV